MSTPIEMLIVQEGQNKGRSRYNGWARNIQRYNRGKFDFATL